MTFEEWWHEYTKDNPYFLGSPEREILALVSWKKAYQAATERAEGIAEHYQGASNNDVAWTATAIAQKIRGEDG